jgi:hypothetical protein
MLLAGFLCAGPAPAQTVSLCGREAQSLPALMTDLMRGSNGRPHFENAEFIALADQPSGALFTFTKRGHPAHPAVVCRRPQQTATGFAIETQASCGADKAACDALVASFGAGT